MSTSSDESGNKRPSDLYWAQMEQLKAAAVCMRLYRSRLGRRLRLVEITKAVASSGSIAGWAVWHDGLLPYVWAAIIATAQLLDALKSVFPFAKEHRAANDLTVALELLFVESELEWHRIYTGKVPVLSIMERYGKLRKLQIETERKYFVDGVDPGERLVRLAAKEAHTYLIIQYPHGEFA